MRDTWLNKCLLQLSFLYTPVRNICNFCCSAALFELICYAQTSEQGLKDWVRVQPLCHDVPFNSENLQNRARLFTDGNCSLPLNDKDFDI